METTPMHKKTFFHISNLVALLWLFVSGFIDSISVFNGFIEQLVPNSTDLKGAWSSSMAFICLAAMPSMAFTGVLVGHRSTSLSPEHAAKLKTRRIRILALLGALPYATLAFAGYSAALGSKTGITLFVPMSGLAFGTFYVLGVEMLVTFSPLRSGVTAAIGLVFLSLGTLVSADLFKWLVSTFGVVQAVYITAGLMSIPCVLGALFVQWPAWAEMPAQPSSSFTTGVDNAANVTMPMNEGEQDVDRWEGVYIDPWRIPRLGMFWIFAASFLMLQAGASLFAYFMSIGMSFSKTIDGVIPYFQLGCLVSVVVRLGVGFLIVPLSIGKGSLAMGSRNVMFLLLLVQAAMLMFMWIFSVHVMFAPFGFASAGLLAVLSGSATVAPVLARDIFGERNGAAAYGLASSIAFGGGEFLAISLMTVVDSTGGVSPDRTPSQYVSFYAVAMMFSIIVAATTMRLKRCRAACGNASDTIVVTADEMQSLLA